MTIQELISELEQIEKQYGNLTVVTKSDYGHVRKVEVDKSEARKIKVVSGDYNYSGILISFLD